MKEWAKWIIKEDHFREVCLGSYMVKGLRIYLKNVYHKWDGKTSHLIEWFFCFVLFLTKMWHDLTYTFQVSLLLMFESKPLGVSKCGSSCINPDESYGSLIRMVEERMARSGEIPDTLLM